MTILSRYKSSHILHIEKRPAGNTTQTLAKRHSGIQEKLEQLQAQKAARLFQSDVTECFMTELQTIDTSLPVQYSDRLWSNLVDRVTVYEDGHLVFRFKNGTEVTERLWKIIQ